MLGSSPRSRKYVAISLWPLFAAANKESIPLIWLLQINSTYLEISISLTRPRYLYKIWDSVFIGYTDNAFPDEGEHQNKTQLAQNYSMSALGRKQTLKTGERRTTPLIPLRSMKAGAAYNGIYKNLYPEAWERGIAHQSPDLFPPGVARLAGAGCYVAAVYCENAASGFFCESEV